MWCYAEKLFGVDNNVTLKIYYWVKLLVVLQLLPSTGAEQCHSTYRFTAYIIKKQCEISTIYVPFIGYLVICTLNFTPFFRYSFSLKRAGGNSSSCHQGPCHKNTNLCSHNCIVHCVKKWSNYKSSFLWGNFVRFV